MPDRYSNRTGVNRFRGPSVDPEVPEPGCYRVRLLRGAPWSVVRIWLGPPHDPETGQEMTERGYRWQATLNGVPIDFHDVWPGCAREPLDREEHDRLLGLNSTMDETSPFYDPRRPIDLKTAPPPQF